MDLEKRMAKGSRALDPLDSSFPQTGYTVVHLPHMIPYRLIPNVFSTSSAHL